MDMSHWDSPFRMEMKCAEIISRQARNGVQFNEKQAHWNVFLLSEKIINIDRVLIPLMPMMANTNNKNYYKKPFKLNGQFMGYVQKYADNHGLSRKEVGGPFSPVWYTPFDVSKSARVKAVMLDLGWMPTEWNIKKQDWVNFALKRRIQKCSYRDFISRCTPEEVDVYETAINGFINHHFVNKSKNYKKAVVKGMGFSLKRPPTFDQIKKKLMTNQFWITSPKITEDSFDTDESNDEGLILKLLKERMVWSHRRSLIQGLIGHVREDGKLSGEANPCATPTTRMRHRIVVNIPAGHATFGKECRSMFTGNATSDTDRKPEIIRCSLEEGWRVKKGTNWFEEYDKKKEKWVKAHIRRYYLPANRDAFVGGDGAGLELRMLTHYLIYVSKLLLEKAKDSGNQANIRKYQAGLDSAYEYRRVLLEGDIHSHNQKLAGLPTRNAAKTFIYAFLYGAGDANLGGQLGAGKEEGAKLRARFLAECPCIPILIEWCQQQALTGKLTALDGRDLIMRRDASTGEVMTHKALNTLLQSAGSIVMKMGMVYLDMWIKKADMKCAQVLMVHDEIQATCPWGEVTRLRAMVDKFVSTAGRKLNMEIELASDSMVGTTWLETH